jgi:hypothetical protein
MCISENFILKEHDSSNFNDFSNINMWQKDVPITKI